MLGAIIGGIVGSVSQLRQRGSVRVSPVAFLNRNDLDAALTAADKVTEITHNHPEGMKGARVTTHAIWLAFQGNLQKTSVAL